jgi:hypothetical protein
MKLPKWFLCGVAVGCFLTFVIVVMPTRAVMRENCQFAIRNARVADYVNEVNRQWRRDSCSSDGTGAHVGRYHIEYVRNDPRCKP